MHILDGNGANALTTRVQYVCSPKKTK